MKDTNKLIATSRTGAAPGTGLRTFKDGTALNCGNLRRMARHCRILASSRRSVEGRRTLLRMAEMYDMRAKEEASDRFVAVPMPSQFLTQK